MAGRQDSIVPRERIAVSNDATIHEGMIVVRADGVELGAVKALVGTGYFQVDCAEPPDWLVPINAIQRVTDNTVALAVTATQSDWINWRAPA